jgi:hypothetical protein
MKYVEKFHYLTGASLMMPEGSLQARSSPQWAKNLRFSWQSGSYGL